MTKTKKKIVDIPVFDSEGNCNLYTITSLHSQPWTYAGDRESYSMGHIFRRKILPVGLATQLSCAKSFMNYFKLLWKIAKK